jgi:alpha-1,3-rhamnosyl/mannosyltransferase
VKVIIDVSSIRPPLTGIGRYALELVRKLQVAEEVADIKFYRDGQISDQLGYIAELPHQIECDDRRSKLKALVKKPLLIDIYRLIQRLKGASILRHYPDYIFHSPNFALPLFNGKKVVTIHDLSVYRFPDYHPLDRVRYLSREVKRSINIADIVIVDSEAIRTELLNFFEVQPEKVVSIPLAADDGFGAEKGPFYDTILSAFGLKQSKYILTVSTIEPRKNHQALLAAYAGLPRSVQSEYPLVLIGGFGWNTDKLKADIEGMKDKGLVKHLDYVAENELSVLYSGASCFCFLSHYEGFGLPVLEAMKSGIPVLSSKDPALKEVCGQAALYVDANDHEEIRQRLLAVLMNKDIRTDLVCAGLKRAAEFSWNKMAKDVIGVYRVLS